MRLKTIRSIMLFVTAVLSPNLIAQKAAPMANSIAISANTSASMAVTSGSLDPGTQELTKNRARVFANGIENANKTRYFYADDESVRSAKSAEELINRLAPSAISSGNLDKVQVEMDFKDPLVVHAARGQEIDLGTVTIHHPGNQSFEVDSNISLAGLTVIAK